MVVAFCKDGYCVVCNADYINIAVVQSWYSTVVLQMNSSFGIICNPKEDDA